MMITGKQVQSDMLGFVNNVAFTYGGTSLTLPSLVNGGVYRGGLRPRDSQAEDIIVSFLTGKDYDVQTGFVNIAIYVPDIRPWDNGVWVENMARTAELEMIAAEWVAALTAGVTPGYKISAAQTITTEDDADINQHFVLIRLYYDYYNK